MNNFKDFHVTKYYSNIHQPGSGHQTSGKRPSGRKRWILALKICGFTLGSLVVLAAIAFWIFCAYMSPRHIAEIIEKEGDKYLDTRIEIGALDYKLFSTYPWLYFEIDTLNIISKSLDKLTPQQKSLLPEYADSLVSVNKLSGKVNIHDLMRKKLNLKEILVERPLVNIVVFDDSISNFNIASKLPQIKEVPKFEISGIDMEAPLRLNYYSLPMDASGSIEVESFFLTELEDKVYDTGFDGIVSGRYGEYSLPGDIPLHFRLQMKPEPAAMAFNLKNLEFSLAQIGFTFSGELKASKESIDLGSADLKINIPDIFNLPTYIPEQFKESLQIPEGISGVLPLTIQAVIKEPFSIPLPEDKKADRLISSFVSLQDSLPPVEFSVDINEANIEFRPPHGELLEANDIVLKLLAKVDLKNPFDASQNYIDLQELRMNGEGISLQAYGKILPVDSMTQRFDALVDFQSPLMKSLSHFLPKNMMKVGGYLKGNVSISGIMLDYGKGGLKDLNLVGKVSSHSLDLNSRGLMLTLKDMKGDFKGKIPSYPLTDYSGTGFNLEFDTKSLLANSGGTKVTISDLILDFNALDTVSGNPRPDGNIHIRLNDILATTGATDFRAQDVDFTANGEMNSGGGNSNYKVVAATTGAEDALIASRVSHTPLLVEYDGGGMISTFLGMVNMDAEVKVGEGYFKNKDIYLYPIEFKGLDLYTNLNRLNLYGGDIRLGETGFSLSGEIDGLRPFLTSYSATPLKINTDIRFSDVDINQLSWGYYGTLIAKGIDSVFYCPPMLPYTASDSVCVTIPRNIDAEIKLHADRAEYMQYKFAPLATDIIVKNGAATLKGLTVGAPYCTAVVDWTYSTTSLDDIFMSLKANVENFNFLHFYKVFPELVVKAPELQNLSGLLNARIDCDFRMFPDMFMNANSLKADFNIKGERMQFARRGKIEKITHLMLIEGDAPLKIDNLNVEGFYHDNLLQINPFNFGFDDYLLKFAGINNLSGDMYYHIALEKSPFHLPFGVSIFGNFKHPEFKVGGTRMDDYRSEMISPAGSEKINANIMAYLHHGWILFVQEAAKYQQKSIGKKDE